MTTELHTRRHQAVLPRFRQEEDGTCRAPCLVVRTSARVTGCSQTVFSPAEFGNACAVKTWHMHVTSAAFRSGTGTCFHIYDTACYEDRALLMSFSIRQPRRLFKTRIVELRTHFRVRSSHKKGSLLNQRQRYRACAGGLLLLNSPASSRLEAVIQLLAPLQLRPTRTSMSATVHDRNPA